MDHQNPLLDMLEYPAFFVKNGIITQANSLARQKDIRTGSDILDYMGSNTQAYQEFSGQCLYLQLRLHGLSVGATVTAMDEQQLFCLDCPLREEENNQLRCLPQLAAQLRRPLHVLFCTEEETVHNSDIRRHLFQLQRIVSNMADVPRYRDRANIFLESSDLHWFFSEILEKASHLLEKSDIRLQYSLLPQCITGMADRELLARAVYNLISNAAKFSPQGGIILVKLTATATRLHFSVQDQGTGIDPAVLGTLFHRYSRVPAIEDGRCGAGFGMALVKAAADAHDGTVLIDRPADGGTRVTLSISLQCRSNGTLRSPIILPGSNEVADDNALMELSDVLPKSAY